MATLKDLLLCGLADIFDAENRIAKALPKMAEAATNAELKEALTNHLGETKGHIEKVNQVFAAFEEKAKSKECKATVGLLAEGDELVSENKGQPTINAAIIAACQKVEHYEIASYGTLIAWTKLLENDEAVSLLEEILNDEEAADEKLTHLAGECSEEALRGESDSDADGEPESDDATGRN